MRRRPGVLSAGWLTLGSPVGLFSSRWPGHWKSLQLPLAASAPRASGNEADQRRIRGPDTAVCSTSSSEVACRCASWAARPPRTPNSRFEYSKCTPKRSAIVENRGRRLLSSSRSEICWPRKAHTAYANASRIQALSNRSSANSRGLPHPAVPVPAGPRAHDRRALDPSALPAPKPHSAGIELTAPLACRRAISRPVPARRADRWHAP